MSQDVIGYQKYWLTFTSKLCKSNTLFIEIAAY